MIARIILRKISFDKFNFSLELMTTAISTNAKAKTKERSLTAIDSLFEFPPLDK